MTMGVRPPAEVSIDRSLVIALLHEQHAEIVRLGAIVSDVGARQRALEATVTLAELLPDESAPRGEGPSR